jgi:hypothetical protein
VLDEFWDVLSRELDRSRRYRHHLTLVRLAPKETSGHSALAARSRREARPWHRRGEALRDLAARLRGDLRSGDCACSDGRAVYLVMPETDAHGAEALIARVRATVADLIGDPDVRAASFPADGLTGRALRAAVTPGERHSRWGAAAGDAARGNRTPLGEPERPAFADGLSARGARPPGPITEAAD